MALRLRRGTNTQRLSLTAQEGGLKEGELIFVTDYVTAGVSPLFIGDGTEAGGVPVDTQIGSINDLGDVETASPTPQNGDFLKWDPFQQKWIPGPLEITGTGVVEGTNYRLNIIGDDSTLMVDTSTRQFTGDLVGNVNGTLTGSVDGDLVGSVFADDSSTTLVDSVNGTLGTGDMTLSNDRINSELTDFLYVDAKELVLNTKLDMAGGNWPIVKLQSQRNTYEAPQPVVAADILGNISTSAWTGSNYALGPQIIVSADAGGTISPGDAEINATTIIGLSSNITAVNGQYFGVFADGQVYAPSVQVGSYATGAEPTTPQAGTIVFDSTTSKFKGWDGTQWVDFH
jgi:hypothetical protein